MRNTTMGIMLTILGIGISCWGYGIVKVARASLDWPIARGIVTLSEVRTTSSGTTGYQHSADIRYEYRVMRDRDRIYGADGKLFQSSKIVVGNYSGSESHARKLTRRFRKGSKVKVHYNHEQPGEAILVPGGTALVYVPFGFGIIATLSGIVALIQGRRKGTAEASG